MTSAAGPPDCVVRRFSVNKGDACILFTSFLKVAINSLVGLMGAGAFFGLGGSVWFFIDHCRV